MYKSALLFLFSLLLVTRSTAQVDTTIGLTAPGNVTGNYGSLAHYLCDPLSSDKEKVNALYNWITHNIKYDVYALKTFPKKSTPWEDVAAKTLKERKGVCEGYSMLFTAMCREIGLKAVNIDGYAKDWMFDNGDKVFIPRHMWCAVQVNDAWELMDPTWGAGGLVQAPGWIRRLLNKVMHNKVLYAKKLKFEFIYDPQYCMQDPMAFRLKHLPTDPVWQLTDTLMPRGFFESGDSAVLSFNKISKRVKNSPELLRISELDEAQKIFEYADRAYKYNDRYPDVLAQKEIFRAMSEVEKAFTDSTIETGLLLVTDAQKGLKHSQDLLKEQKKSFPDEYNDLKKKNKVKNQAAKQDIRKIKADDKRMIAQCKKYANTINSKGTRARKKQGDANKRAHELNPNKINKVETAKMQKKSNSPELKALVDSIEARKVRIAAIQKQIDEQSETLSVQLNKNRELLDALATSLGLADSIIIQQTIARLKMKDNYDDEVIVSTRQLNDLKYKRSDTLLKYYMIGFDTITTLQDRRQKTRIVLLDLFKKNLRSIEQYRKWNSSDNDVTGKYADVVKNYSEAIVDYNHDLSEMSEYLNEHKKLFANITKLGKRQIKIAAYMDKAESMRKALEEKKIGDKQLFDAKENQKQQLLVQELEGKLQKITDTRN